MVMLSLYNQVLTPKLKEDRLPQKKYNWLKTVRGWEEKSSYVGRVERRLSSKQDNVQARRAWIKKCYDS